MSLVVSRTSSIIWSIVTITLLGVSLFASSLPSNQYQAIGIHGGIDCEGPLAIFLVAIPSFIFCSIALLVFPYKKTVLAWVFPFALMLAWIICLITITRAFQEQQTAHHQESCQSKL